MRRSLFLAVLFAALLAVPMAAHARTDDRTKPVVYVHGFSLSGGTDCNMWNNMDNTLRSWGLTGTKVTVQYYGGDTNCGYSEIHHGSHAKHYGGSHTTHDQNTDIRHLGYHLAWMIADHFPGQTVDLVGHSMGSLIVRYMVAGIARHDPDFPATLSVEDVVTMGGPHSGTGWAYGCGWTQCVQMRPGSSLINWLASNANNPQGTGGTDWTVMGSDSDGIVSSSSAVAMGAAHKVIYLSSNGIGHSDYYNSTSDVRTADVNYEDNGGPWYAWYNAPYPVRWSDFALLLGTW